MDEHRKRSEGKRREYQRRYHQARLDGGSRPSDATRADLLGKARDIVRARHARLRESLSEAPSTYSTAPREMLMPGHVAVPAETVLGFEAELADALATREACEQHRMSLLELMQCAQVPPAAGNPDLFKLEHALETGEGLPRNATEQLLEVVRELIRWRAAVPSKSTNAKDAE